MTLIRDLPNLGPKSEEMLRQAGITSWEQLAQLGSVAAYIKVKKQVPDASLNLLWSLEGALSGQDWKTVAQTQRTDLLLALDAHLALDDGK